MVFIKHLVDQPDGGPELKHVGVIKKVLSSFPYRERESCVSPADDCTLSAVMLPRVGKEFVVRMQFNWRPLFQGRALLLTNTLSGGVLMAVGDIVQQSRENYKKPDGVRDWKRTGEKERTVSSLNKE